MLIHTIKPNIEFLKLLNMVCFIQMNGMVNLILAFIAIQSLRYRYIPIVQAINLIVFKILFGKNNKKITNAVVDISAVLIYLYDLKPWSRRSSAVAEAFSLTDNLNQSIFG